MYTQARSQQVVLDTAAGPFMLLLIAFVLLLIIVLLQLPLLLPLAG